jgi:hypothetical protein
VTQQEYFDKTVQHLIKQGRRAADGNGCKYRLKDGAEMLMCAAGVHIPDSMYSPNMEGNSIEAACEMFPDLRSIFHDSIRTLSTSLQLAHDDPTSWDKEGLSNMGIMRLRRIAANYGLSSSVLAESNCGELEDGA